jgi:hypothetical protein
MGPKPNISLKYKMGDISQGVANALAPAKIISKKRVEAAVHTVYTDTFPSVVFFPPKPLCF